MRHVALGLPALIAAALAATAPPTVASPQTPQRAALDPAGTQSVAGPQTLLFRGVTVVPMRDEQVLAGRDVLVRGGRIERIAPAGSLGSLRGAQVIDGRGRFLIPGLAEMHAHVPGPEQAQYAEDVLLLFVAHGITTIRGMLGHPWHLELRERLERGELIGPRLYTAGPSFNDRSAPDAASATRMVREQHAAGYDFLKLHPGLTPPVFDAIAAAARELGMEFGGHVSEAVGLERVLDARQRAIDHLDGYMQALVVPGCRHGPVAPGLFGVGLTDCAEESLIPAAVARTKAAGTWMVPTQILLEQWAQPPDEAALARRPAMRYVPARIRAQWRDTRDRFLTPQAFGGARGGKFIALRRALLREMHRAGVPIALGSDAPQVFNVPGDSAHGELRLYGEIGLSPYEALRTATVMPARFFGAERRFGTIAEGMDADLVLLRANPLEDLGASRSIEGVALRGRWLGRRQLDARLEALAARAGMSR